jgi:hypothetical protein
MAEIHGRRFDYRSDNKSFDLWMLFHYGCVCGHALGLTRYRKTQSTGEMSALSARDGLSRDGSSRPNCKGLTA